VPLGAVNVFPGRCEFSIDIRSDDNAVRSAAFNDVVAAAEQICARRSVKVEIRKMLEVAVCLRAQTTAPLSKSIERVPRYKRHSSPRQRRRHDAMVMQQITDIGMLFVRCGNGGISHHPDETMTAADAEIASLVFKDFLLNFYANRIMTDTATLELRKLHQRIHRPTVRERVRISRRAGESADRQFHRATAVRMRCVLTLSCESWAQSRSTYVAAGHGARCRHDFRR